MLYCSFVVVVGLGYHTEVYITRQVKSTLYENNSATETDSPFLMLFHFEAVLFFNQSERGGPGENGYWK